MKKYLALVIMVVAIVLAVSATASAQAVVTFNKDNVSRGIISLKYTNDVEKKTKVLIQHEGDAKNQYQYNIKSGSSFINFPLQLGNGQYTIGVYEQIEGTKYVNVAQDKVSLLMDDSSKVYLASVQLIDWTEKMDTVKLAKELTKNEKTEDGKIEVCYQYMVQQFKYDFDKLKNLQYDYIPVIDDVLKKKLGICYDYAAVYASMLRSQGIKAKLIMGYTTNVKEYHAWNNILMDDDWIVVDTTYDSQMYLAKRKYSFEKPEKDYSESLNY